MAFGTRYDAVKIKKTDAMHGIMPYLLPNRADNEAVSTINVDLTNVLKYVEKKNESNPDFKYTPFHVICAAIGKTFYLRPKLNRFYCGTNFYQRKDISLSFVVKRHFNDNSEEGLAIIKIDKDSTISPIEQIHSKVEKFVTQVREDDIQDSTTDSMDFLLNLPHFLLKIVFNVLNWLNTIGKYPKALEKDDPYFSSVFMSNLGSLKFGADYHHLTNWGTNSFFCLVNTIKPDNHVTLGITVDERIADGLYFANSNKYLKYILENPEILDLPLNSEVNIDE